MAPGGRLVLVGRAAGAFGVRGEVRLAAYTEQPLALLGFRRLLGEDGAIVLTLTGARPGRPGELVARAEELATREQAEALKGVRLFVPREALPAPDDEDEFYLTDLIGLDARTPDGEPLGRVKAVLNHGAGDILEIETADAGSSLVAFTRENVPEVRLAEGVVVVDPPQERGEPEPADTTIGPRS